MINENIIPNGFQSWNQFYQKSIKGYIENHPTITVIKFQQRTVTEEFNYEFTVDFIKSKCFDEFMEEWYKLKNFDLGFRDCQDPVSAEWFSMQIEKILFIDKNMI